MSDKKKILFIEDEGQMLMMMQMRLEANGYTVIIANNGEEGLKKVREEKPDLVLLDILMPKLNGYEVCRNMKENPETKQIPILIVTASGAFDLEDKCKKIGANDIIRKPFKSEELLAKIKVLLPSGEKDLG